MFVQTWFKKNKNLIQGGKKLVFCTTFLSKSYTPTPNHSNLFSPNMLSTTGAWVRARDWITQLELHPIRIKFRLLPEYTRRKKNFSPQIKKRRKGSIHLHSWKEKHLDLTSWRQFRYVPPVTSCKCHFPLTSEAKILKLTLSQGLRVIPCKMTSNNFIINKSAQKSSVPNLVSGETMLIL